MAGTQSVLSEFRGIPEEADHPAISRKYAREWWWSIHEKGAYECPDCGRGIERVHGFEVHHIDGDPTNNDPDNLVAVCHRCHIWRHKSPTMGGLDVEEWKEEFGAIGTGV